MNRLHTLEMTSWERVPAVVDAVYRFAAGQDLRDEELFGDLAEQPRFVAAYTAALDSLHARGARATVEGLVTG